MSWVGEQLKTLDFRKSGDFRKFDEILGIDGKYPTSNPKGKV